MWNGRLAIIKFKKGKSKYLWEKKREEKNPSQKYMYA